MLMELLFIFYFLMAQKSDQNLSCYIIPIFTTCLRIELSCENNHPVTANNEMRDNFAASLRLLSLQSQVLGVRTGISSCLTLVKENRFNNARRRSRDPQKYHL